MRKISELELASLVLIEVITITFGINATIIIKNTGINSWLTAILSYIIGFIPLLLCLYISSYKENIPIYKKISTLYKKISPVINIFITLILLILAMTLLYNINSFIISQFLYRTPLAISTFIFIAVSIYLSSKNTNTLTRTTLILTFINYFLFLVCVISLFKEIKLDNFFPILKTNTDKIFPTSLKIAAITSLPLLTILFIPKERLSNPANYNKTIIISYIIGSITSFLVIISVIGTLGIYLANTFEYPEYIVLRKVSIFGSLERVENIVASQWIIGSFLYISIIIAYIKENILTHFKNKKKYNNIITIAIGAIISIIPQLIFNNNIIFDTYKENIFPYIISLLLIIYIILVIKIFISKRKKA